jgi:hypothetical protein
VVALRRVVVHDVQDHFDARAVEGLDEIPELVGGTQRVPTRAIASMRGEEGHGAVSPVVDQAGRAVLPVELEHGQQLHRGDSQVLQVGDPLDHPRVGPPPGCADARAGMPREAGDVHLVDYRGAERPVERGVPFPVVGFGVPDDAPHGDPGVVAGTARRAAVVPIGHHDPAPVGIEQQLRGIEAEPARRVKGARRPVRIDLSGAEARHERVPVVVGPVRGRLQSDDAGGLGIVGAVEQHQFQPPGFAGEDAEVDAAVHEGGAQREAPARRDGHGMAAVAGRYNAPKISMPMLWPCRPTYRAQPSVAPGSTETRAVTESGSTCSR